MIHWQTPAHGWLDSRRKGQTLGKGKHGEGGDLGLLLSSTTSVPHKWEDSQCTAVGDGSCPRLWGKLRLRFQHLPSRCTDPKPRQRGRGWRLSAGDRRQSHAEGTSRTHAHPATVQFAVVNGKNAGMVKSLPLCRSATPNPGSLLLPGSCWGRTALESSCIPGLI